MLLSIQEAYFKPISRKPESENHCDAIPSLAPSAEQSLNSKTKVIYGNPLGQHKPCFTYGLKAYISDPAGQFMSVYGGRGEGCKGSMNSQEQDGRDARFSRSYATQFPVEISRICEFCVIMGIMTRLLGRCLLSTLGLRANDYVKKTSLRSDFNCIIRLEPSGASQTTSAQPRPFSLIKPDSIT